MDEPADAELVGADPPRPARKIKKTVCPINRREFRDKAKPVDVILSGAAHLPLALAEKIPPKEFKTGTLGWYGASRRKLNINGKSCDVTVQVQIYLIGSKELPPQT